MALKLSLKPGERFVVNGAVFTNGDRRTTLIVQNKVSILREKDILKEDEITTPARRIYWPIMLAYLDEEGAEKYLQEFMLRMTEFMNAIEDAKAREHCVSISADVMKGRYYKALMTCRKLFAFEEERLTYVP